MKQKQPRITASSIASYSLGVLGYISCTLQWLWAGVVMLPPLLKSGALDSFTNPKPTESSVLIAPSLESSPLTMVIIGIITAIMLTLTLYILLRLPRAIANTGEKIVQTTTDSVLPIVTHHKKLPVKKRRVLSLRLAFYIRFTALVLPLVITSLLPAIENLPRDIVIFIAGWLAIVSLVFFSSSYFIAARIKTTR